MVKPVPEAVRAHVGDALAAEAGAIVAVVAEGSPAAKAGIQRHDIVTQIDGTRIDGPGELVEPEALGGDPHGAIVHEARPRRWSHPLTVVKNWSGSSSHGPCREATTRSDSAGSM